MEQSGETANLAILDGTEAVFIAQVQCHETMRTLVKLEAACRCTRRALARRFSPRYRTSRSTRYSRCGACRASPKTRSWRPRRCGRRCGSSGSGVFRSTTKSMRGSTRCVAATVYDEHAEPLGAISLAGPSSRLSDERIRQLGPLVAHGRRADPHARRQAGRIRTERRVRGRLSGGGLADQRLHLAYRLAQADENRAARQSHARYAARARRAMPRSTAR